MNPRGAAILQSLCEVTAERTRRAAQPALGERVAAIKAYQHARFERSYADLLASPRYAAAARFFLNDLYGPADFTRRDDQFARIVPALVRLFSADVVATVASVASLHALSEQLDSLMAQATLASGAFTANPPDHVAYAAAWRAVGQPAERQQQIALMLGVGRALDGFTRKPLLRQSLRMMRGAAQLAGLGTLHEFIVAGFETFRAMGGADDFLLTVSQRESELAARLFAGGAVA
ncbi:conserved hypothetical protein [Rubrivivax sp. A210]|nr:conserved hypothetical protein [Rubrivivax sp. A210]